MNTIIEVNNVHKDYRLYVSNFARLKEVFSLTRKCYHHIHHALKGISVSIEKGETLGIIGSNGSGKSTLLKIISNIVTPTGGSVMVNGKISALLELGAGFNTEYSGMQNIYLNGIIMGYSMAEMQQKVQSIIEFADIGEFIDQPVKTYSSGMFARLAFAVAINVEPDILIVDEALSVGDVSFQSKCFRKFTELRKSGVTVLFVSHDIASVRQLCSRVLWIEQGEQRMLGDPKTVCNAYSDEQIQKNRKSFDVHTEEADTVTVASGEKLSFPQLSPNAYGIRSETVEFVAVFVTDSKGKQTTILNCGEAYTVHTLFHSHAKLDNILVGFNFCDKKGNAIFGSNTEDVLKKNFSILNDDVIDAAFHFTLPFIRDADYLIEVAVSRGTNAEFVVLTWLHNTIQIRVHREGNDMALVQTHCTVELLKYHSACIS